MSEDIQHQLSALLQLDDSCQELVVDNDLPELIRRLNQQQLALKQQNEELLRHKTQLELAQRIAKLGSWSYEIATDELTWSEEMYRIFDRNPILGPLSVAGHYQMLHPDDEAKVNRLFQAALNEGVGYHFEFRIVLSDHSIRHLVTLAETEQAEDGRVIRVYGTTQDITAWKKAEEEREKLKAQFLQAQKMEAVGKLTAGIAHDFNNLLTSINGFADLLRAELSPDEPGYELAEKVLEAGHRAAELIKRLLIFSRKETSTPQPLNLNISVTEMNKMLQRIIGEDIQLQTKLDLKLWPIIIDPVQMEQIIINLVVNARDAMPTGGQLTIRTANLPCDQAADLGLPPADYVWLRVQDTGLGIKPEIQSHIFEPFFTTKEPGKGTGLGLATVHNVVKQYKGHIKIYSPVEGGAIFDIYFPRAQMELEPRAFSDSKAKKLTGQETILLVEDEDKVRELMQRVLQNQGYTLLVAANGDKALHLAKQYPHSIDLLLTDVVMPRLNGRTLARQLNWLQPTMKTLFISGYSDEALASHLLNDPQEAFLAKPFTPIELSRMVRQTLDTS